jgi:hypothetical protein
MTHNVEMAEQLTFKSNKAVAYEWHRWGNINYPDENYARENLQLHQIGLPKLMEDGSPKLDKFGKHIPNYTQQVSFRKVRASYASTITEMKAHSFWFLLQNYYILEYLRRLENIHWFGSIVSTRKLQRP